MSIKTVVERKGYCSWCVHLPEDLPKASKEKNNICHVCWFKDGKPHWAPK